MHLATLATLTCIRPHWAPLSYTLLATLAPLSYMRLATLAPLSYMCLAMLAPLSYMCLATLPAFLSNTAGFRCQSSQLTDSSVNQVSSVIKLPRHPLWL